MIVTNCRSCDAPIIWTETTNGKKMPVDADSEDGTFVLVERDGQVLAVHHTKAEQYEGDHDGALYASHFSTCPERKEWRKPL